jgi:hypothetical protein
MSSSKKDRVSDLGEERWRSSRRQPTTFTSGGHPHGHSGANRIGRGRDGRPISSHSSKLLSIFASTPIRRVLLYVCGERCGYGTGCSRCHRCKAGEREGRSGRKRNGRKLEDTQESFKEESEHSHNGPPGKSDSDCAPGQRIKKNFPHGGRNPRSFAGGL